uniref:LRRNT domain-containing protein n=1 Tax=Cyanoderma ruficeps TaxID=181631 RepID=A0A8C3QXA3_9PASS
MELALPCQGESKPVWGGCSLGSSPLPCFSLGGTLCVHTGVSPFWEGGGGPRDLIPALLIWHGWWSPAKACPAACRCSPGEVDCSERGLREVPWSLSPNTSALWLGYNFITVLGPRSFPLLPGLRLLSLVHNRLELIHSQALLGLRELQELDLSHNHLTVLTPETFLPLTSLATLNLGSNRLGELEPGVLDALPQLQALLLQDNPWVCSCSILPLWRWLSHNREKVRGECPEGCVPKPPCPLHQLNKYPIMAFGDESFRQCQDTSLSPQHYIAFFIIGPFSFIASIFFCTFLGSLVVLCPGQAVLHPRPFLVVCTHLLQTSPRGPVRGSSVPGIALGFLGVPQDGGKLPLPGGSSLQLSSLQGMG